MNTFEIIKQVDNGSLHTTKDIYPLISKNPSDTPRQHNAKEIKAFERYCSIMDCIGEKQITGDKETVGDTTNYSNLRLTKAGKNLLRWSKLTINDIDNSSGKESIKTWFLRPVITGVSTALIVGLISFIAAVYFSDTIRGFLLPQGNSQQQTQVQEKKENPKPLNEKTKNQ